MTEGMLQLRSLFLPTQLKGEGDNKNGYLYNVGG
jgi:hypothetical protein